MSSLPTSPPTHLASCLGPNQPTEVLPDAPHRKLIKHYEVPRQARMFTFSCYRRLPLLLDDRWRLVFAHALTAAAARHRWVLLGFVFMPEHAHILTVPWDGASDASALLFAVKRPASFRIKQAMARTRDPLLSELIIRERPGKTAFRFWQEGPGHDRNIHDDDQLIHALNYIHANPVTRGLCQRPEDWAWSSARQYLGLDTAPGVPTITRWSWGHGLRQADGGTK
jgi:putative transposase